MTAPQLLALIAAALLLQLGVGVALALARRQRGARSAGPADPEAPPIAMGAWAGWRDFRVVRRACEDAAQSQCSFYLAPVDGLPLPPFRPGQYLSFALPIAAGPGGDGPRQVTRCYSLSDRPDPNGYRVTIKRVPPPPGRPELPPGLASNHFHDHVRVGDVLRLRAPAGHFFLDPDPAVPAVLVAGGIGITPMMSMLLWCAAEQPQRVLHLYYGVRNGADQAYKPVLAELAARHAGLHLHLAYSSPGDADVAGRDFHSAGHVDLALLRRTLPHGRHQFYICGPAAMMNSLVPGLREWGVPEADLHFEAFGPATARPAVPVSNQPVAPGTAAFEVRFRRSGRSLPWDGQDDNLLALAERHDLAVESGCRAGSCGACQTRVLSGGVDYAERPGHDIAPGHCLLCVGRPRSALVLEA